MFDILVPAYPGCHGNWQLNECRRFRCFQWCLWRWCLALRIADPFSNKLEFWQSVQRLYFGEPTLTWSGCWEVVWRNKTLLAVVWVVLWLTWFTHTLLLLHFQNGVLSHGMRYRKRTNDDKFIVTDVSCDPCISGL